MEVQSDSINKPITRRTFLLGAAGAAAAVGVETKLPRNSELGDRNREQRIGILEDKLLAIAQSVNRSGEGQLIDEQELVRWLNIQRGIQVHAIAENSILINALAQGDDRNVVAKKVIQNSAEGVLFVEYAGPASSDQLNQAMAPVALMTALSNQRIVRDDPGKLVEALMTFSELKQAPDDQRSEKLVDDLAGMLQDYVEQNPSERLSVLIGKVR